MKESKANANPTFPIYVRFENGEVEQYDNISALETDLEVFDSDTSPDCEVRDALGKPVRLRVNHRLELEELSLKDEV